MHNLTLILSFVACIRVEAEHEGEEALQPHEAVEVPSRQWTNPSEKQFWIFQNTPTSGYVSNSLEVVKVCSGI